MIGKKSAERVIAADMIGGEAGIGEPQGDIIFVDQDRYPVVEIAYRRGGVLCQNDTSILSVASSE